MIGILIPAHNEEDLLDDCLSAAMRASRHGLLAGEKVEVLVVLDSCTDRSAQIVSRYPVLSLHIDARNVGQARAAGAQLLLERGARWISCSDADSRVADDWLVAQLGLGADAVCGTVTVERWHESFDEAAQIRYHRDYRACDGHRHIHGANLGISADAYRWAGALNRWRATKMYSWCASWNWTARTSPGAIARKCSPARGSTVVRAVALVTICEIWHRWSKKADQIDL